MPAGRVLCSIVGLLATAIRSARDRIMHARATLSTSREEVAQNAAVATNGKFKRDNYQFAQ